MVCKTLIIKKLKRVRIIYCSFAVLSLSSFQIQAKQLSCDIPAPCAILINADTGAVLYEKNAHKQTYPASTTKIATALYALYKRGAQLNHSVIVSADSVCAVTPHLRRSSGKHPSHRLEFGGSHMYLKAGEVIPFKALMYGLMVCSGNDAANAIAEYVSGSVPQFIAELNLFLKSKGCQNTNFTNPHGLPDPLHVTTAHDLALMAAYAMKSAFFRDVVKTVRYKRPKTNLQDESFLLQSNALIKPGKYFYPYAIGVKTGYTNSAGSNIVAAAEKDGRKLIAVVLNCSDMSQRYRSCMALFDTAFNESKIERKLFSKEHDHFSKAIDGAKDVLKAGLMQDVIAEYYPSEEFEISAALAWDTTTLPINQGDVVGEVHIKDPMGRIVKKEPLIALEKLEPSISYVANEKFEQFSVILNKNKHWLGLLLGTSFVLLAFRMKRKKSRY
jgi:D-alanyl-D-alanine carboxypeptidase (penicillin-binding protein 5/6)